VPSILTHCLCGDEAVNKCNSEMMKKVIAENKDIFYLGCQGPDPFLFYHYLPFKSKDRISTVRKCSRLIHRNKVNDFFFSMLNYAKRKNEEQLFVYIAGFLAHNAMDSIAHPYINYQTGSIYKNTLRLHQIFENQIDLAMLKLMNIERKDYRADKKVVKLKDKAVNLAEMMVYCIKEVFDYEVTAKDVIESYDDMAVAEKILTDSKKTKYGFFKGIENLMKKPNIAVSMMLPLKYDQQMDAMNYRQKLWYNPCDLSSETTEAFEDLFDRAVKQTAAILDLLGEYIVGVIDEKPILEIVDNRNYDNGRSDKLEMKYFRMDMGIGDYEIRLMELADLEEVSQIYQQARDFMKETGNPEQWKDNHPSTELIKKDIENKTGYIVKSDNEIKGVFAFIPGEDVTYKRIEGKWLNNFSYGTIHRIAAKREAKGILNAAVSYVSRFTDNIRIDTHKDNKVMQHLLAKLHFKKCGIIYLPDGSPRIAYQKEVG
jgi:hypothetical protein